MPLTCRKEGQGKEDKKIREGVMEVVTWWIG
jgi:hypothetical protein